MKGYHEKIEEGCKDGKGKGIRYENELHGKGERRKKEEKSRMIIE